MDNIDMSLDEIISKKRTNRQNGASNGGGGARFIRGRRGRGSWRSRRGRSDNDGFIISSSGRWKHDLFEGDEIAAPTGSRPGNKLLVSNLEYGVSDSDLRELFGDFGPLRRLAVHYDRSGRSCGTAEVCFENRNDSIRAMQEYNGVLLDGRPMVIQLMPTNGQSFVPRTAIENDSVQSTGPIRTRQTRSRFRGRLRFQENETVGTGYQRRPRRMRGGGNAVAGTTFNGRFPRRRQELCTAVELDQQLDQYKSQRELDTVIATNRNTSDTIGESAAVSSIAAGSV